MKTLLLPAAVAFGLLATRADSRAQGTAFTYQGRLLDAANPATGSYDLRFTVFDSASGPTNVVAGPLTNAATGVTNGLFTVSLDFGTGVFPGANRWLEIAARSNGAGSFLVLAPRQKLTATPYAITAGGVVNSGSGLTNLNASALSSGVVADVRLGTNVARLNANQVFTGTNLFTNSVGIGSLPPLYPLDVVATGFGLVHESGSVTMGTFVDSTGGWLGTLSSDPLSFFVSNQTNSSLTIDPTGLVGIGTSIPITPLNVVAPFYGIEQDAFGVSLSTYVDATAGWLGTVSVHPLFFYVANNAVPSMVVNTNGRVGIGTSTPAQALSVVGNISATGTINGSSDRNAKEHFTPIDPQSVLESVAALPISRWNYRAEADVTHLGPMAQDFYEAFRVGEDDRHISMVDADGVALAAIQGLNQKLEDQLKAKDQRIEDLEERLARLEKLVSKTSEK
jgi:Chaperone of endosialidase